MSATTHPLYPVLQAERAFLLPRWRERALTFLQAQTSLGDTPCDTPDRGMCRFTVAFLQAVLKTHGVALRVAGGSPWPPTYTTGGFLARDNRWYGHYWLTDGQLIVDIAASQFGADDIIITTVDDPRYQSNFTPAEIREHLLRVRSTLQHWKGARARHPEAV